MMENNINNIGYPVLLSGLKACGRRCVLVRIKPADYCFCVVPGLPELQ